MQPNPMRAPDDLNTFPMMPRWGASARVETLEDGAFLSGAALSHLHSVLARDAVPRRLLGDRLALSAAEACVIRSGRPERMAELRDARHLLRPGDLPGPAGAVYEQWRRAVARPITVRGLGAAMPGFAPTEIADWLDTGTGTPITRAAMVLERVLTDAPRYTTVALILAEAALSQALGWGPMVPLLATGLRPADLRKREADLAMACHGAVITSARSVSHMAVDLTRRTAHLRAVAPKLRAKQAAGAVEVFLTQDAAAPAALPLPDRAARRLCDRLVTLGAVRELTGRDTFRLYGV